MSESGEALESLGEELVGVPVGVHHRVEDAANEIGLHDFVEQVKHRLEWAGRPVRARGGSGRRSARNVSWREDKTSHERAGRMGGLIQEENLRPLLVAKSYETGSMKVTIGE